MSLSVTSWPQAFDFRIAHENAAGLTVNSNCLGSNGIIRQVQVNNSQGDQDVFIKIKDALSAANNEEADWIFRVKAGKIETVSFEDAGAFSAGLTFWATRGASNSNVTAPSVVTNGTVKVTILVDRASTETEPINVISTGYA
ncbi:MAG: hypothetical protein Unbinned80contig1000_58 [Prokaryotic dsDNA virus sp.]|nr:MAG: hypothetical protein Unbinned80contig1000_58 [Prokaryotic dsDNA virus sp.]|tara:strand:+ start:837 stop:1262 length:426 start_codon:yes stop_codon:yes gene_type:complete